MAPLIRSRVVELHGIDPKRMELVFDQGHVRSLNKAELFYALEMLFNAGYTEKEVVIMSFGLLQHHGAVHHVKSLRRDRRHVALTGDELGIGHVEQAEKIGHDTADDWQVGAAVRDLFQ